jgi:hypothetical protein
MLPQGGCMAQQADARLLCHFRVAVVNVPPQQLPPYRLITWGLHSRTASQLHPGWTTVAQALCWQTVQKHTRSTYNSSYTG